MLSTEFDRGYLDEALDPERAPTHGVDFAFWQRWSNSFLIKLGNQMKISRCRMTLIGAMQNQEWATIWLKP